VWHTFGFPEPEIFGFLYVHPVELVSVGIFVRRGWGPIGTAYRYCSTTLQHPALMALSQRRTLRSWGAKSLRESGKHGEPFLTGDGLRESARGSGSTNMPTNSVDEAWTTGVQLADAVVELAARGESPSRSEPLCHLTFAAPRKLAGARGRGAKNARNGFHGGLVRE